MAKFKIMRATQKGKSWQAKGVNPVTGKEVVISGGTAGVKVGPDHRTKETIKSFHARHANPATPKQYINKKRWDGVGKFGSFLNIPNRFFE